MDKTWLTNGIAILFVVGGVFSPFYPDILLSTGLYALSGAVTNWLAIYMLFEKVPLLYGSGVIPSRFEEFKRGIKAMVMAQFFNEQNLKRFISQEEDSIFNWLEPDKLVNTIDYDSVFDHFAATIMESSLGSVLRMFGGPNRLERLREPFTQSFRQSVSDMVHRDTFKKNLAASIDQDRLSREMGARIEDIVDSRLNEMTPQMVKDIVQKMIREHLGWLVVWGGVFGGAIGFIVGAINLR